MGRLSLENLLRHLGSHLYVNSLFLVSGRLVSVVAGFIFWAIAARLYTISEVGIAAALISSLGMVILFSRLGLDFSLLRYLPTGNRRSVFNTILAVTTLATVVVAGLYVLAISFLSPTLSFIQDPAYASAFLVFAVLNSIVAISGNAFTAMRKGNHYLLQNVLLSSRIPLLVPLVFLGSYGIFSSVGLAYAIGLFFAILTMDRLVGVRPLVDKKFIKESLSFSAGNYVSSILTNAPVLLMPMMILVLSGEAEAAKYYIAFTFGHIVLIVPEAVSTSLFVEGSHGENLRRTVIMAAAAMYLFLIPATIIVFLYSNAFLGFIGSEYTQASDLLGMLTLSGFLYAVSLMFVSVQNIRMRIRSVVKFNLIRFVLLLGLSYILVLEYGILGVGYAWIVTYGILAIAVGIYAKIEGWF